MKKEELLKKLEGINPERVKVYLEVLDKIILQSLVIKLLEKEDVENILSLWQEHIKSEIDFESNSWTDFLMGTQAGRVLSNSADVEDGESLRLSSISAMNFAKEVAFKNYLEED